MTARPLIIIARRRAAITATARPSRSAGKACARSTRNRGTCAWLVLSHQHGRLVMPKSRKRSSARRSPRAKTRRAKPGARGHGGFFHIQVRPRTEFVFFRNQDVGRRGGIERVAGRRANGSWDTQKWLIGKIGGAPRRQAARAGHRGGAQGARRSSARCRAISAATASSPSRAARFPASEKPTPAMRRAQLANIKKAQAASCATAARNAHDPQAAERQVPALFAQEKSAHRQAAQSRHFQLAQGGRTARTRHPVFQAALKLRDPLCALSARDRRTFRRMAA